ncbi:hypothetical protein GH733_000523, partial [Mirounga leonina]
MKQKNHPAEVIFSIKPLYFGTEDRPIDYPILSQDEVRRYYILGSDMQLNFSGSHQNHIFFASGSSYCSVFSRGCLWTFWQDASIHLVLSKVIIRQLFGAVGVSGSSLIFYRTEISSGGILSKPDVHKIPKPGNAQLRNDRQIVSSAPKKGEIIRVREGGSIQGGGPMTLLILNMKCRIPQGNKFHSKLKLEGNADILRRNCYYDKTKSFFDKCPMMITENGDQPRVKKGLNAKA